MVLVGFWFDKLINNLSICFFFSPLFRYLIFSPWAIRYMCSMHLDIYSCAMSYMIDCNSILSWRCVKMLSWTKGKKHKRKQVPAASLIWNIVIIEVKRRYLFCFVFCFFKLANKDYFSPYLRSFWIFCRCQT